QKMAVSFKVPHALPVEGQVDSFIVSPLMDDSGAINCFDVLVLPAVSDSSSLQRERDDAISLLTSVFNVSEVGIVVTDRHQRILRVNDSFIRIYGWGREELIGKEFIELMTPEERGQAQRNHEEFMRSGVRSSGEMKIIRRDG